MTPRNSRDSNPGSNDGLFSPLPTKVIALHFYQEDFPSLTRVELRRPMLTH